MLPVVQACASLGECKQLSGHNQADAVCAPVCVAAVCVVPISAIAHAEALDGFLLALHVWVAIHSSPHLGPVLVGQDVLIAPKVKLKVLINSLPGLVRCSTSPGG